MSGIREVIVFLENNPKSKFSDIAKTLGLSNTSVRRELDFLNSLGCLIKTGCRTRYRYSIPEAREFGKTKSPVKKYTSPVKPTVVPNVEAKKQKIAELIEKRLYNRAQTAISQLIAESGDQDTVNWALDKNAACGAKIKYF